MEHIFMEYLKKRTLPILECHEKVSYKEYKMNEYDKLCDILEENIDMDLVNSIINGK